MPRSETYICVKCRITFKGFILQCSKCRNQVKCMGRRWRAPKKNNIEAWKQIAAGNILWDKKAIERKAKKAIRAMRARIAKRNAP